MKTLNPAPSRSGSSVSALHMYDGIPLVKATDQDFQKAIDWVKESTLPGHVKAGLETAAMASGEDYRAVSFIVDDLDYIRAETAAQVVRCALALDEREVSSEFDLAALGPKYRAMYFTVYRFLSGDDAKKMIRIDPLACAMGWLILDPLGLGGIIDRGGKLHRLFPS